MTARLIRRLLGFRGPGHDTQLGTQRIGQRHDERELRPHLARGEQAPHAGGVAIDPPRQLGLGDAQVSPERVKLPDHRIGLGDFPRRPLIRRAVLRVLHPPLAAALMQAHVEHLRGHGSSPQSVAQVTRPLYLLRNTSSRKHSADSARPGRPSAPTILT